jgi:hypothetical protein
LGIQRDAMKEISEDATSNNKSLCVIQVSVVSSEWFRRGNGCKATLTSSKFNLANDSEQSRPIR